MFPLYDDNPIQRTPLATYALVAINVLMFLWANQLPETQQQVLAYRYGFVPARIIQLRQPQPIYVPINVTSQIPFGGQQVVQRPLELDPVPRQIWMSLLTCMFLHGRWLHLLGNMWFLWIFGDNVEDRLGALLYLILYLLGGVIASISHWLVDPDSILPVIGASGAIAAVLGAYAITWPWTRVRTLVFLLIFITIIDVPALIVLGAWFLAQLLAGHEALNHSGAGGVAWWAHVGGFLAGMVLMPVFSMVGGGARREEPHEYSE